MSAPKEQSETPNRRPRTAQRPAASVNMEELRELIALLRDNGLAELELENEGFRVRLRRESGSGTSYGCRINGAGASGNTGYNRGFPGSGLTYHSVAHRGHVLPFAITECRVL